MWIESEEAASDLNTDNVGLSDYVEGGLLSSKDFNGTQKYSKTDIEKILLTQKIVAATERNKLSADELNSFFFVFAATVEAGLPLIKSFDLSCEASGSVLLSSEGEHKNKIIADMMNGTALSESLQESGIFPEVANSLVRAGEESGELPRMCERIATYYS